MKKLTIFVWALMAMGLQFCSDAEMLKIPDANPIQFWTVGVESYNQKVVDGVQSVPFCLKYECNDEIHVQGSQTDNSKNYDLHVVDKSGSLLLNRPFGKKFINYQTNVPVAFLPPLPGVLSPWASAQSSGQRLWQFLIGGLAESDASSTHESSSGYLYQKRDGGWPTGNYVVNVSAKNVTSTVGAFAPLESLIAFVGSNDLTSWTDLSAIGSALPADNANHSNNYSFTTAQAWTYIGIIVFKNGPTTNYFQHIFINSATIISGPMIGTRSVFDVYITPSDDSICDDEVQFQIWDHDLNTMLKFSDGISIRDKQSTTRLINYSNSNDFAGLDYGDVSPAADFNIRVDAVFFEESFPDVMEDLPLSDGTIVQLNSEVMAKKLLTLGLMPFYMHKKMQLILAHDTILIDGGYWLKQDQYSITDGNPRYPLRKASVLLTDRDFYERNVL